MPAMREGPEPPLRWTSKSFAKLRETLLRNSHGISERTLTK